MSCENRDFLEQDGLSSEKPEAKVSQHKRRQSRALAIIAAVQSIILVVIALLYLQCDINCSCKQPLTTRGGFPPAESSLEFHWKLFDKYGVRNSPTAQKPGPALDAAWHNLLSSMMIRVSEEELRSQTSESSIPLADGTGYVASLGVYHEVHCIKLLKHWLHKDHYLAGWDDDKVEQYWLHLNHCLDWLKDAALCRSDTTLTTLAWNQTADGDKILDTEYPVQYQCVKPDSLFDWAKERAVEVTEPGVLVEPD